MEKLGQMQEAKKTRREALSKQKEETFARNSDWLIEYEARIRARRQEGEAKRQAREAAKAEEQRKRQVAKAEEQRQRQAGRVEEQQQCQVAREEQRQERQAAKAAVEQLEKETREQQIREHYNFDDEYEQTETITRSSTKRAIPATGLSRLNSPSTKRKRSAKKPVEERELLLQRKRRLQELLNEVESEFEQKQIASQNRTWCNPIPLNCKIDTVQNFLKAMTDEKTLPTATCPFCYLKKSPSELRDFNWKTEMSDNLKEELKPLLQCQECFHVGDDHDEVVFTACQSCLQAFQKNKVPKDCSGELMFIGCEHRYPTELDTLTPLEEKLIALNTAYGYITKFAITKSNMEGRGLAYRKHIKGHITVFPNDIEGLATTVLPHPLVKTLSNIHIIWSGPNQPSPQDVSKLFSVRKDVIKKSLQWLQRHNPLYSDIETDWEEITSWQLEPSTDVPTAVLAQMQRQDETAEEQIRTAHIVPPESLLENEPTEQVPIETIVEGLIERSQDMNYTTNEIPNLAEENNASRTFELTSTGMFSLDKANLFEEETKLDFITNALETEYRFQNANADRSDADRSHTDQVSDIRIETGSQKPFINVSRGSEFADPHDVDFFPKTFPSLFPFGRGGPKTRPVEAGDIQRTSHIQNHSLKYWARTVLRRHGGRFATHPVFAFLVFNMLVRSSNRRISTVRMTRSRFKKVERLFESLTRERLDRAREEMRETGGTTDQGIQLLLRELSIFGYAQPLSNDTRLQMRRKIISLCIRFGLPAIWFTINPNDLANPIKLRLAAYRNLPPKAAEELLSQLYESLRKTALSVNDPVSSVEFFRREILLFFQHFIKQGQDSVFGHISHYYAGIETNERGALHLHGLMWFTGNMELHNLSKDMANSEEEEYRQKVIAFVDDVFTECLDAEEGSEIRKERKVTDNDPNLQADPSYLKQAFESEANFVAFCSQVHSHSATCVKYSMKDIGKIGFQEYKRQPCRFKAPWKIVPETHYSNDGILEIKRNHQMVNRYNKSMAVALRHNHDISMILSKKQGLSLVYYMTNYATKLHTPMWKRIAFAAEVHDQLRTSPETEDNTSLNNTPQLNKTRQFLMRLANRVFTERELSAVEVVNHLFDYETDYTNVKAWTYLHLNTLYWAVSRQWPQLRDALFELTGSDQLGETVHVRNNGFQLSYVEAYKYRGPVLANICLFDYLSFVKLERRQIEQDNSALIPFDETADFSSEWVQHLRKCGEIAIVSLQGHLTDDHNEEHDLYFKRSSVLFLGLFAPWQFFLHESTDDITNLWWEFYRNAEPRIKSYVHNISLLRISAEDAKKDAKQWANRCDGDDTVDAEYGIEADHSQYNQETSPTMIQNHRAFCQILTTCLDANTVVSKSKELKLLVWEAKNAIPDSNDGGFIPREADFYQQLQEAYETVLQPYGLMSKAEIGAVWRTQKRKDASIISDIDGSGKQDSNILVAETLTTMLPELDRQQIGIGPGGQIRLEIGAYTTYAALAYEVGKIWTLNKLQQLGLLLIAESLDKNQPFDDSKDIEQHLQYIGGEGGTGKSRIIDALKDVFRLKDQSHLLLITGSSGSAAAKIGGITIHSACGLRIEENGSYLYQTRATDNPSEETRWRWRQKLALVLDEVSMIGGSTLYDIDQRLQMLRGSKKPFGGLPLVLFTGDFYQFSPVVQTSLLIGMEDMTWDQNRQRQVDYVQRHQRGHNLFRQVKNVVILQEQVRAGGCGILKAFLKRLRRGEQTEADFSMLKERVATDACKAFSTGLRAITPLNRNRWQLNIAAVVEWARYHRKHISIFLSTHVWDSATTSEDEMLHTVAYGDDSKVHIPGIFPFASGIPVVLTKNIFPGLKMVNGAEFTALDVLPDVAYPGYHLADDVTIHFGPPHALILQSDETKHFAIPGIPEGTLLLKQAGAATMKPTSRAFQFLSSSCRRSGLPCSPAFAMTDFKAQGSTFPKVMLELLGKKVTTTGPSKCDFMSLYVQLSRGISWEGTTLSCEPRRVDFIEPINQLDGRLRKGIEELDRLAVITRQQFEERARTTLYKTKWFQDWQTMPEEMPHVSST